jgi:hypothetical protein
MMAMEGEGDSRKMRPTIHHQRDRQEAAMSERLME